MRTRNLKSGSQPVYQSKPLTPHLEDSYKSRGKLHEPTVCPQCGAVFDHGRWQWLPSPEAAHRQTCPACHRIHDDMPAGFVRLEGDFLAKHRDEMVGVARNLETKERARHPLQRIIKIAEEDNAVVITTTDSHLARDIGEAIRHAYQGELEFHYNPDENLARVHWRRS